MRKLIVAVFLIVILFAFFGCNKKQVDEVTSNEPEVTMSENLENEDNAGSFENEITQDGDISMEMTTKKQNKDEIIFEDEADNDVVETTQSNEETSFTVIFKGYDGKILKTEKVKKGEDATAPEVPEIKGFLFVKWDTYYKAVKTDITVTAVYKEITAPTLIVDTVKTNDKEVVVKVSAVNNPGLLALLLKINYDESALTLKKVENGSTMKEYTFTGPKKLKSGCNVAWNIIEVPENVVDGEVVLLHFGVNDGTPKGSYDIAVTCFDGAFNSDYEPVDFDIVNGAIIIK